MMKRDAPTAAPAPIWLAALAASGCQAVSDRECRPIGWHLVGGRAVYTNLSPQAEVIEPLGVRLDRGETLSVTWIPGDTAYTVSKTRCA
jgi:hypothetical protein